MPDPALILRRANVSRKGGSWQDEDYAVFDREREVGRVYLADGCGGNDTWFWGVSFQVTKRKSYGYATSLDDAKAAFRAEYGKYRPVNPSAPPAVARSGMETPRSHVVPWSNSSRRFPMSDDLKYQLRLTLNDGFAQTARNNPGDPMMSPVMDILKRHDAVMKCQHDAFAGYVREAEANGVEKYPLYEWTKATVDDPVKEAKYTKSFTLYVGGDEVYEKAKAEALEAALQPLVGGPIVAKMFKYDTNPANSPQPPRKNG